MAQQGGKGKQSSQSDKNYWARLRSSGGVTKRKAARVAQSAKSAACLDYGRAVKPLPLQRVVFSGSVQDNYPKWGISPIFVISEGKTIDVCPRESDAMATFRERKPGTFTRVVEAGNIPRVIAAANR